MSFPNLTHKHAQNSMFSAKEFLAYQKRNGHYPKFKAPQSLIFCYNKNLLDYVKDNHAVTKVEGFSGEMYLLNDTNKNVAIIGKFGIGAPVVGVLLEELIAFGIKFFISIGTSGTLQKHVNIGDLVVCEKAIRDEGTSYHYLKRSKYAYASKELTKKITQTLDTLKQSYHQGTSWTIDAPYRETVAEARQYQQEGVLTVEMEASALFAIAKYRNVQMGAIFTISDSLAELEWKPKFHTKKTNQGLELLYKMAVEVLK